MIGLLVAGALLQAPAAEQGATTVRRPAGGESHLDEEVARIGAQVSLLRHQPFVRLPFAIRVPDAMLRVAAEIRALNVLPRERLEARGRAWSDVGLGDGATPRNLLFALATDLDGIGFDSQGQRLFVGPARLRANDFEPTPERNDPATLLQLTGMRPDAPVLAHLLMHVRQRERSGRDTLEQTTDRMLAATAWAEGEANLVALRTLFSGMQVSTDVMDFLKSPGEVLDGRLLPIALQRTGDIEREFVNFVHVEGYARAAERFRAGGWAALDAAMAERRTTSDLLHPGRAPLSPPEFPAPRAPSEGLRLADEDSLGQQAIAILVSTLTGKESLGLVAAEGWAGDRLRRWEGQDDPGGQGGVTEWLSHWRAPGAESSGSAADPAADFAQAYRRAIEARCPGRKFVGGADSSLTLVSAERIYTLERQGSAVRVLVGPLPAEPEPSPRPASRTPPAPS